MQAEALSKAGGGLRAQLILVGVNGKNVEGMPAAAAIALVGAEKRAADAAGLPLALVLRDPLLFRQKLLNAREGGGVATQARAPPRACMCACGCVRARSGRAADLRIKTGRVRAVSGSCPRQRARAGGVTLGGGGRSARGARRRCR